MSHSIEDPGVTRAGASNAGDGARIGATRARSGVRRGLYKVLAISTLLAIAVLALVWIAVGPRTPVSPTHVAPAANQPATPGG